MESTMGLAVCERERYMMVRSIAFWLSSTIGGLLTASAVAVAGQALSVDRAVGSGAAVLVGAAVVLEHRPPNIRVPSIARQVSPFTPNLHRPAVSASIWGFQLGLGVTTIVNSWGFWAMLLMAALLGDVRLAVASGAVFGFTRGAQPALAVLASPNVRRPWLAVVSNRAAARYHVSVLVGSLCILAAALTI
jgi:prepilin signal peptidase PulO-like enzyme (type II secretory pathway)